MRRRSLSLAQARRVSLAAQGFDRSRPGCVPTARHIRRVIDTLGLLQLDFVNVLVPAHLMIVYSRLGSYDTERFHKLVYDGRDFIEHWAHEASIVPTSYWPLLKYRRDSYKPWPNSPIMKIRGKQKYLETVLQQVAEDGALCSNELPPMAGPKRKPGDWHRSVPRWALEVHFGHGNVSVAGRKPNYQRIYDLPHRVIDEPHFSAEVSDEDAKRQLLEIAASCYGIATPHDLADYFRMSPREAIPLVQKMVDDGQLLEVDVESWEEPALMHPDASVPRQVTANSLLSPFDPVVWFRPRALRLFDFHYRIEIYVPAAKRKWGYYVLPFLMDDRIAARVDLKADRKASELLVLASHPEEGVDEDEVASRLAGELRHLADWLGLDRIRVSRKGKLARALGSSCRD